MKLITQSIRFLKYIFRFSFNEVLGEFYHDDGSHVTKSGRGGGLVGGFQGGGVIFVC